MSRECKQEAVSCFHCHQLGHVKANCPTLTGGGVQAPAPTTLRITDGKQGRAPVQKAKTIAYQMTAEEAAEAPRVITGTYLPLALV